MQNTKQDLPTLAEIRLEHDDTCYEYSFSEAKLTIRKITSPARAADPHPPHYFDPTIYHTDRNGLIKIFNAAVACLMYMPVSATYEIYGVGYSNDNYLRITYTDGTSWYYATHMDCSAVHSQPCRPPRVPWSQPDPLFLELMQTMRQTASES